MKKNEVEKLEINRKDVKMTGVFYTYPTKEAYDEHAIEMINKGFFIKESDVNREFGGGKIHFYNAEYKKL